MLLSVVVTIVDGGATLVRCLDALERQWQPEGLDVVVPYDESVPGIAAIGARFPRFRFIPMGRIGTRTPVQSFSGQHELFDQRRAAGLAAVQGDLVAIVEDRGIPRPDWASTAISLHARHPYAAIGGAVENGRDNILNWAVYFCDFGRYQLPFPAAASTYATDVNVCYKRNAIDTLRPLWADGYQEPTIHGALLQAGETIFLSPLLIVDQTRDGLRVDALCRERIAWARLYADIRKRDASMLTRVAMAALCPALPFVLVLRYFRDRLARQRSLSKFLTALPVIAILACAWSLGEAIGFLSPDGAGAGAA